MDGQLSVRTVVLLISGAITAYVAYNRPAVGTAIVISVAVVALLHNMLKRD